MLYKHLWYYNIEYNKYLPAIIGICLIGSFYYTTINYFVDLLSYCIIIY